MKREQEAAMYHTTKESPTVYNVYHYFDNNSNEKSYHRIIRKGEEFEKNQNEKRLLKKLPFQLDVYTAKSNNASWARFKAYSSKKAYGGLKCKGEWKIMNEDDDSYDNDRGDDDNSNPQRLSPMPTISKMTQQVSKMATMLFPQQSKTEGEENEENEIQTLDINSSTKHLNIIWELVVCTQFYVISICYINILK